MYTCIDDHALRQNKTKQKQRKAKEKRSETGRPPKFNVFGSLSLSCSEHARTIAHHVLILHITVEFWCTGAIRRAAGGWYATALFAHCTTVSCTTGILMYESMSTCAGANRRKRKRRRRKKKGERVYA
jgi:hypothetical protein